MSRFSLPWFRMAAAVCCCWCRYCPAGETPPEAPDYADPADWVLRTGDAGAGFDVFYVYPTLVSDRDKPWMEWRNRPEIVRKAEGFVTAQTGAVAPGARIFAPYVRQLEYNRCLALLKNGIADGSAAELADRKSTRLNSSH